MSNSGERVGKRVVLGQIGKVHGIQGWLRLNSFTIQPENILEYSELFAEIDESWQVLEISESKQLAKGLIVHFKGYDDPDIAKQLTGLELTVFAEKLPHIIEKFNNTEMAIKVYQQCQSMQNNKLFV